VARVRTWRRTAPASSSSSCRPISPPALPGPTTAAGNSSTVAARVSTGSTPDEAWLEATGAGFERGPWSLRHDGKLKLDDSYRLDGRCLCHGITFDQRQVGLTPLRRLAAGPSRVWQNRLHGASLMATEPTAWTRVRCCSACSRKVSDVRRQPCQIGLPGGTSGIARTPCLLYDESACV
jgi:hypothetical protein